MNSKSNGDNDNTSCQHQQDQHDDPVFIVELSPPETSTKDEKSPPTTIGVPKLCFGLYKVPNDDEIGVRVVLDAIDVGYRHFDKNQMAVSYPFGHGLSYTDFEYSDMEVALSNDTISLALSIKNVGAVPGKEVVQIYFSKEQAQIDRPINELLQYAKTRLLPAGEAQKLAFRIPVSDLSYWDENKNNWNLEKGVYTLKAATSSRAIKLTEQVTLN